MNLTLRHLNTAIVTTLAVSALLVACDDDAPDSAADAAADADTDIAANADVGVDSDTTADSEVDTTNPVTGSTAGILCAFSQSVVNNDESVNATSTAAWSCDATTRSLSANGLPDHEVGTFPNSNNPSAIRAQTVDVTFPLAPQIVSETGTGAMTVAYILNGVKVEVGTAGRCTDAGDCTATVSGQWRPWATTPSTSEMTTATATCSRPAPTTTTGSPRALSPRSPRAKR